jgi:hypothetical protein
LLAAIEGLAIHFALAIFAFAILRTVRLALEGCFAFDFSYRPLVVAGAIGIARLGSAIEDFRFGP